MPTSSHESTLARQWQILRMLPPRRPGVTVREIHRRLAAEGHAVTYRTVERDLDGLSSVLPLVRNEISTPYGWHWLPGARIDFPGMSLPEAVSLGLLEDLLRQLVPSHFTRALEGRLALADSMLKALPKNRAARWTDLVRYVPPGLPLQKPTIAPKVLENVQQALLEKLQLTVKYQPPNAPESRELTLNPLALILQGERPYLLATAFEYTDPRYYAIHRIARADVTEAPAIRPAGFSLDHFLADGGSQFGDSTELRFKARINDELAALLEETPMSDDQKIRRRQDGNTLAATVRNSWQLYFWIHSQGPAITVLGPASLRKAIVAQLEETLATYR